MRILLVEDDPRIASLLRRGLSSQHYSVDVAEDGENGLELGCVNQYDLIVLDIMLPKLNGREVCVGLREARVSTPVLMLTALDTPEDIVTCLDHGADDYLTKPFDLEVLYARVRSLIRRTHEPKQAAVRIGDLTIDTAQRTVTRAGRVVELTPKEFALLEYLALNKEKAVTREQISEHVWDMNFDPRSNVIDSLVRLLRQKVDVDHAVPLIHTVRGVGYRLMEPANASGAPTE